jgi:hypothetical protein
MSQQQSSMVPRCKFCGVHIPSAEMNIHIEQHINDFNTPIAIFDKDVYLIRATHDYTHYTHLGKCAVMRKFINVELPHMDLLNEYYDTKYCNRFFSHMFEFRDLYNYLMTLRKEDLFLPSEGRGEEKYFFSSKFNQYLDLYICTMTSFLGYNYMSSFKSFIDILKQEVKIGEDIRLEEEQKGSNIINAEIAAENSEPSSSAVPAIGEIPIAITPDTTTRINCSVS